MTPDKELLGQLSVALVAVSTIIYLRLMLLRRIKPHMFTWLIWGLTVGIAAAGRHVEHAGPGAWAMAATSVSCLFVAALSMRFGERSITRGDVVALVACLSALPLWYFTANALAAIILVTVVDLGGYYPTARKSYLRPQEEATYNLVLANVVHGLSLAANQSYTLATTLTPLSMFTANSLLIAMIWWRRGRLRMSKPLVIERG